MRYFLSAIAALFLLAGPAIAAAQTATLTGKVIEPDTRVPVAGATVTVQGADVEAITDSAGSYRLELEPGSYTLQVEAGKGYETKTVEGVEVTAGATVKRDIKLARADSEDAAQFGEYTVRAGYLTGTVGSVLSKQQEAEAVTEVIGSEQMSRSGDSSAADTVSRLTGLSIEKGKFAVIRGQPKRYTSTTFNGSPLPSLDPIQDITALDLFPAQALSNLAVQKSYTADRSGSFGAGQIQLDTVGLPQEDFVEIGVSVGVNSESTGEKGRSFDVDSEDDVADVGEVLEVPGPVNNALVDRSADFAAAGASFSDELMPQTESLNADKGLSLAAGQRVEFGAGTLGFRFAGKWDREYRQEQEERIEPRVGGNDELVVLNDFTEQRTEIDTDLSGFGAVTWKTDQHRVSSNTFFVRNATERTEISEGFFQPSDSEFRRDFLLEFEQREMLLQQFTGNHDVGGLNVKWRAQTADADRELPDRRTFRFLSPSGNFNDLQLDRNPDLIRRWNRVDSESDSYGIDLTYPVLESNALKIKVQGGVASEERERQSEIETFRFATDSRDLDRPIEALFGNEAFLNGTATFNAPGNVADDYSGEAEVEGYYVETDVTMPERFRITAGVRVQEADYEVRTFQAGPANPDPIISGFDQQDTLPSIVGSWFVGPDMQLRAGFSRSVSYPVLVEVSDTTFIDPDTDEIFAGNPDLGPATIDSYDLRWEWYPSASEAITAGVFFKDYDDPIERSFGTRAGGGETITLRNAESGEVYGLEFSSRLALSRLGERIDGVDWLDNMYVNANLALVESEVKLSAEDTNATNLERAMTDQAENILNLQVGYQGAANTATLTINRVGETLQTAGTQGEPDEFEEPTTFVDAKWTYNLTDAASLSLELENITDEVRETTQGRFTTESLETGRSASLGFSYRF